MNISRQFESAKAEGESEPFYPTPIIDIIRHGETEYKELQDRDFKLDVDTPDFEASEEKLDLTEEGIKNIYETANKLASIIDKENEAVYLVSSPQFRAQSSQYIIESILAQNGITLLNPSWEDGQGLKITRQGLGQIPPHEKLLADGFGAKWLQSHKNYLESHPEIKNKPPAEVHQLVAASLGMEMKDIFSKSHDDLAHGFKSFLRQAINIKKHLGKEANEALGGKRLRIVCVTHEERVTKFAQEALGTDKAVEKGQLLEVDPRGFIESDSVQDAKVTLFGKSGNPDLSKDIEMRHSEDGLSVMEKAA